MDNQDKIFNKIKNAAQKAEEKDFPAFEKVWMRVEEKLDKKEDKKAIALWKKLAVAASLLLFFSLGYQFLKPESKIIAPNGTKENNVVIQEKQDTNSTKKPSEIIKSDAEVILKKQIEKPVALVIADTSSRNLKTESSSDNKIVTIEEDNNSYNEVVVVGYATQKKSALTGSVTSVSNDYLSKQKSVNVSQALQGRVAGVQITNNPGFLSQGSPELSPTISIRGNASISQSNDPIYIIDGVPVNAADFKQLKPENVKSINVLKDATATSLYGSRASNGVIIINTKNGTYQNLSKKELERKLKKLDKNKKPEQIALPPKSIEVSQEDYDNFVENQFESPKSAPLSTFSIDVDNASYTNVRRFINNGQSVPKDAVRVEEMMNFFKYKYPQPQDQNPFSINTEYSDCPWNSNHKLLKIGLQGKNIPTENLPASNLVFLIDVSGSMGDANKLPLLKQSLKILVNELRKKDKVAIVVYAGAAGMVLPPTTGDEKQTIINALENLNAGGSTAGGAGINLAYKLAQENFVKGGNNRVILATDGDFNVGASSNTDMQTLIEEKRKSGVFLTCLGYGMDNYKDSKMETLADKGNGNYAYIDNIQEANRFLGKEFKGSMFAIAKDVKIQIEFNPKQVQAYRLIGYENRKLRPEDFTNDAIDAGELGSNHTVTALYEVIPTGVKSEFLNNTPDLKYTKTNSNEDNYSNELATIKFRYKKPDGDKSIEMVKVIENKSIPLKNSSDDFKFSTAVAWFGLKLRDSNLVPNKTTEDIKKLAKEGLSNDDEGYKAEFVRLVETVK
ncbi:von Willebrand factor type A domain-containing protein [Flavobacterium sp.]|uniref:vWA domain-containing protein n=1 Tax=Flavobacterium sp. TaxID=239 RepID=UPI0025C18BFB|nr:von Willebrand factor type A domain-containing protein [Flavobacterium sp.]MBA4276654.1 VWA domain-containing protein [Flavobacterium sp.]